MLAEFTVAGTIDSVPQDKIKSEIVKAADVETTDVTLSLVAGSVKIFAAISVPAGKTATAISSGITATLGSKSGASAAFGVTVESAAQVQTTTLSAASSAIVAAGGEALVGAAVGLATGILITVIVVPIVVVALLVLLLYCCYCKKTCLAKSKARSSV